MSAEVDAPRRLAPHMHTLALVSLIAFAQAWIISILSDNSPACAVFLGLGSYAAVLLAICFVIINVRCKFIY